MGVGHGARGGNRGGGGSLVARCARPQVRATNRDCYAHGALAAAKFLVGKPIGLYGINDVLGL